MTKEEQNEKRIERLFEDALEAALFDCLDRHPEVEQEIIGDGKKASEDAHFKHDADAWQGLVAFNKIYQRLKSRSRSKEELEAVFKLLDDICADAALVEDVEMCIGQQEYNENDFFIVWSYDTDENFSFNNKHPFPKDIPLTDNWAADRTDYDFSDIYIEGDTWLDVWRAVDKYGKYHWWELGDHYFFEDLEREGDRLIIRFGS